MVGRCVINSVVMWLHIMVGPCWCVYIALFRSRKCEGKKENLRICLDSEYGGNLKTRASDTADFVSQNSII